MKTKILALCDCGWRRWAAPVAEAQQTVADHRRPIDGVISVQDVGVFKPNQQVYRYAARRLKAEPCELLMVSSNSFDVVGARVSGYRGAYVNRYDLPYDETPYRFDIEARDLLDMARQLGCK